MIKNDDEITEFDWVLYAFILSLFLIPFLEMI